MLEDQRYRQVQTMKRIRKSKSRVKDRLLEKRMKGERKKDEQQLTHMYSMKYLIRMKELTVHKVN